MDETTIVKQMQSGDAAAFDRLFELYKDRLFRMAYLISGNYADSEDIVQETFVKCYLNCRKLKDVSSFSSWLYQILTRTAWRSGRNHKREQPVEEIFNEYSPSGAPQPLEQVIQNEEQRILLGKIGMLEVRQRTVVVLYYYNGLSTKEIARIMDCMEGTVKSRLHTARKNLKMALSEEYSPKEEVAWKTRNLML